MDYGRFKYEQSKKAKEAKKHASTVELKEIKFRPKTDEHDLAFKIKHVTRFLEDGNKCRLVVIFRGREVVHPKTGLAVLDRVLAATSELSQVEVRPNLEGKRMIMIIGPKPGIKRKAKGTHDSASQQQTSKRKKGKNKPPVEEAVDEKSLDELNAAAEAEAADDDTSEDTEAEATEAPAEAAADAPAEAAADAPAEAAADAPAEAAADAPIKAAATTAPAAPADS
jgi:translation initiation factor IF-3